MTDLRDFNKNTLNDLDGNGYIHIDNIQDINPPYTTFNEYLESIPDNKTITISDNKLGIQHLPENNQLNNVNITIYSPLKQINSVVSVGSGRMSGLPNTQLFLRALK